MVVYLLHKLAYFFYKIKIIPLAYIVYFLTNIFLSCDIPYQLKVGKKTFFPHHALGTVIHKNVVIGDNCRILQGTTIGIKTKPEETPIIGNNVYIGANCTIVGPITIGNNVVVGGGSVVVKSIPDNEVWAGNPAKKIRRIRKMK